VGYRSPPVPATEEESAREVEVVMDSDPSPQHSLHEGHPRRTDGYMYSNVYASSSDEVAVQARPGPSRPLKRARGRPRKDGSGPFKEPPDC